MPDCDNFKQLTIKLLNFELFMVSFLYNKHREKVLSTASFSERELGALFHNPNFYAVIFFDEADGYISLDNKVFRVENRNVLFYYPFQKISISGHFNGSYMNFHPNFFCIDLHIRDVGCQGLLFNNFFEDTMLRCSESEFELLSLIHKEISVELSKDDTIGKFDMIFCQVKMLLVQATRLKMVEESRKFNNVPSSYFQIEHLLDRYFKEESRAEFYSSEMQLSLSTFNRLCKKYFNRSFNELLTLKRVATAKNRLFLTESTVKAIAYEVGYNDPLYFSRVFKKETGVTPKEFRNSLRSQSLL